MKKVYVVYLMNDNFGFDGIVGVFDHVELARKAADDFSIPNIYEQVINKHKEYL